MQSWFSIPFSIQLLNLIELNSDNNNKKASFTPLGSTLRDLKWCSSPASYPQWCEVKSNSDSRGSAHSQQCFDTCQRVDLKHSWWWSARLECSSGLKIEGEFHFYMLYMCEVSHGEMENEVRSEIMETTTLKGISLASETPSSMRRQHIMARTRRQSSPNGDWHRTHTATSSACALIHIP